MKKKRSTSENFTIQANSEHSSCGSESAHEESRSLNPVTCSSQGGGSTYDSSKESVPSLKQKKLFCSLQYNKNLLKYLNDDRLKQCSFCDLSIIVEGEQFNVHKVVVAVGSSYFHAFLSKNPNIDFLTLDHVNRFVFQHLLEFLYTSEFYIYESEIPMILEAAKFLDITDAVKLLDIQESPISSQTKETVENSFEQTNETVECASINEVIETVSDSNVKLSSTHQCSICNRNFCYRKSLENHLSKAHSSLSLDKECEGSKVDEKTEVFARRSTRARKCPPKFQKSNDNDSVASSTDNLEKSGSEKDEQDKDSESSGNEDNVEEGVKEESSDEEMEQSQKHDEDDDDERVHKVLEGNFPEGLTPFLNVIGGKKMLKCPKCDKTFDRVGKYESHTRVHTGEKPFECDICHQRYSTKSNLSVHQKKHSSGVEVHKKEHKCPCCNKLHASKKTLSKHIKRFHPDNVPEFLMSKKKKTESWKCEVCNKSFTRKPHLEEHMILHTQHKPFKCTYCEEHFKSRFARLKHQEKFHLGPFPCDVCGRQFNDTGNLKRHIECTHRGKRKWTCFICGKSVRERTTLKEHLRIHSGEKPHLCSICGQSFRHGSSYRLHLRVHHEDKRYECGECGKTFIRHDHLTKHKKIHSGEKAHQCEECGKCFGRRDHLTVHYRSVHLGEKIWQKYKATFHQCEVCKKVFKGKSSLEMHFRTHSGEKPYTCHICNQSFRIKKTLTKHMVIHSDARPFNCTDCSATFKRKDKLKYHMDHVHGSKNAGRSPVREPEDKLVTLPVHYASDSKVYQTEAKEYVETTKVYQTEAKQMLPNISGDVCVPVILVPVQMSDVSAQADPVHHSASLSPQSHGILPHQQQPQQTDYQRATDLAFLEKYTLTPQPANIVHPVRADQMLDPRDQSYLGTLLGLDSASASSASVQSLNTDHP
ncbi:zinc finger and BTB domain-containing protein 41 [Protopterus annectens]|uniref:zinc finger and BTB domain-containing protein 41 n=1 Tax=Protopterus annectens TaxID=7888 RepID=UPI001CFB79A0|nr:zinc finger and BTB domain-containing protein 41 [Protopterus annectens]XP_043936191.1 zinc finger and BTB domain-containing protein 41 [Protopterus annectens]